MVPEYVQKIKEWPFPKKCKEVTPFLGFAGYYQTFIPQYSALTNRLKGIKKAEKLTWNEEKKGDFMELKKAFTKERIQAFLDVGVGDPFILTMDWIKENIARVLSQVQDGKERFLGWMLGKEA